MTQKLFDLKWNPVRGCSAYTIGCEHCRAAASAGRLAGKGKPYAGLAKNGEWTGKVKLVKSALDEPKKRKKPSRILVCDMSDLFHESLDLEDIQRVLDVIADCPEHEFFVMTKRAFNLRKVTMYLAIPANLWVGISIECEKVLEMRLSNFARADLPRKFLVFEPMLEPMTPDLSGIGWVLCGAETGRGARDFEAKWARALRKQCKDAGVPFCFLGMGPGEDTPKTLQVYELP